MRRARALCCRARSVGGNVDGIDRIRSIFASSSSVIVMYHQSGLGICVARRWLPLRATACTRTFFPTHLPHTRTRAAVTLPLRPHHHTTLRQIVVVARAARCRCAHRRALPRTALLRHAAARTLRRAPPRTPRCRARAHCHTTTCRTHALPRTLPSPRLLRIARARARVRAGSVTISSVIITFCLYKMFSSNHTLFSSYFLNLHVFLS